MNLRCLKNFDSINNTNQSVDPTRSDKRGSDFTIDREVELGKTSLGMICVIRHLCWNVF